MKNRHDIHIVCGFLLWDGRLNPKSLGKPLGTNKIVELGDFDQHPEWECTRKKDIGYYDMAIYGHDIGEMML